MEEPRVKQIISDGECPMCQNFVARTKKISALKDYSLNNQENSGPPSELVVYDANGKEYRNAQAVAYVVATRQNAPWLLRLASVPGIAHLLTLVYRVVARYRYFLFGPARTLVIAKAIVLLGCLVGVFLSLGLWLPITPFPRAYLINFYPAAEVSLFGALIVLVVFTLGTTKRWPLVAVPGLLAVYCLGDLNRAQPWIYYYALFMLVLAAWDWKRSSNAEYSVSTIRMLLAAVYVWSGIQKLNPDFFGTVGPWFLAPLGNLVPGLTFLFPALVYLLPVVELASGALLLFRPTRRVGGAFIILMHVFILFTLGPAGYNFNSVVWPWNIVMALLVLLAIAPSESAPAAPRPSEKTVRRIAFVFVWLLPALSYVGYWPKYFSGALYSGNLPSAEIVTDYPDGSRVSASLVAESYHALNVPTVPSQFVYQSILRAKCLEPHSGVVSMQIFDDNITKKILCSELPSK